jgi:hypothetical protein
MMGTAMSKMGKHHPKRPLPRSQPVIAGTSVPKIHHQTTSVEGVEIMLAQSPSMSMIFATNTLMKNFPSPMIIFSVFARIISKAPPAGAVHPR